MQRRPRISRFAVFGLLTLVSCRNKPPPSGESVASEAAPAASASSPPAAPKIADPVLPQRPDPKVHSWLADASLEFPKATETLSSRFQVPPGYTRVPVDAGSFGHFLRTLPLAAAGTPVLTHKGDVVRNGDDPFLAAVVAIDTGKIDLQQSPDIVIRLHAEWQWSKGARDMTYRGATGLDMPLLRWAKGERVVAEGRGVYWLPKGKPTEVDHGEFRRFLDAVFTWANSTSLAQQAETVPEKNVQPGDFFLHLGSPGHALVILDIAKKAGGSRVALFGQALNPAQNLFVLRLGKATTWFSLRGGENIITPYTDAFSWEGLRRLPTTTIPAPP